MYFIGVASGASGAFNTQGANIIIPQSIKAVYLQPSASGVQFELGRSTGSTGSTFATTDLRGAFLTAGIPNGPYRCVVSGGASTVVGIYNVTGGNVSVRVYAAVTA